MAGSCPEVEKWGSSSQSLTRVLSGASGCRDTNQTLGFRKHLAPWEPLNLACECVHMCVCVQECVSVGLCIIYVCMFLHAYVNAIWVCVCAHVHLCLSMHVCACVFVCVHVCVDTHPLS